MGKQLQKVAGSAGRLNELFVALRQLAVRNLSLRHLPCYD